jgi:excisionase family DNA binding protein
VKQYLSVSQVAQKLVMHRNTIHKMLQDGAFPNAFKGARCWRIPVDDVRAYIDSRRPHLQRAAGADADCYAESQS